jgi:hypothetical protein
VTVVHLDKGPAPSAPEKVAKAEAPVAQEGDGEKEGEERPDGEAEEEGEPKEKQFGILGVLNSGAGGDPKAPSAPWGSGVGDAFGAGGLGLSGIGAGGGGNGEGLGSIGTGRAGTGTGAGFGRSSGSAGTPPQIKMGATTVSGRLPPEVIQRIVRQNFGRFRLCYENGLRKNPTLTGQVKVRFVIGRDGAVSNTSNAGADLPDPEVVNCVIRSMSTLAFPQPEGGVVVVVYPIKFSPGSPAPAAKAPSPTPTAKAPAAAATAKPAPAPPPPAKQP